MAKYHTPFGESAVDQVVKRFFERKGINPDDVSAYTLRRSVTDFGTIAVEMYFDDEPAEVETTGIGQTERASLPLNYGPGQPRNPLAADDMQNDRED